MSNIKTGRLGESIACEYLVNNGYMIIATNLKFSRFCEIDIIAKDKETYVFCEVKTRNTLKCGHPLEAITKSKYHNIKKGLHFYLKENPHIKKFRIDAISIILKPKLEIKHIRNI